MLHNFSLWCDFIERDFLKKYFTTLVKDGVVNGATSNPAIFKQALQQSSYQEQIASLKTTHKLPKEIYESLAIEDISQAADILEVAHIRNKQDGFVSLEIDPFLANDAQLSIEEGLRLFKQINKKNVMIKVPATNAGYEVIEELIAKGVPTNATLVFSLSQTRRCIKAYKKGLETYKKSSTSTNIPQCVISIFVSRFDRVADNILKDKNLPVGLLGIRNAQMCYSEIIDSKCESLRALFASTGVKNKESFPEDYYITNLLYSNAINTAPLETIEAFRGHISKGDLPFVSVLQSQQPSKMLMQVELEKFFKEMQKVGIDVDNIANELLNKGLEDFKDAFRQILDNLT